MTGETKCVTYGGIMCMPIARVGQLRMVKISHSKKIEHTTSTMVFGMFWVNSISSVSISISVSFDPWYQLLNCLDSIEGDSLLFHKNRKDICYFARNVQIQGYCLYCDHFLKAFITDYESLVAWYSSDRSSKWQKQTKQLFVSICKKKNHQQKKGSV